MVGNGRKKGTTRFAIGEASGVRKAQVAGDFNGWKPVSMRKQKSGDFVAIVALCPGTYEYKFILDGEWRSDPDNHSWAPNAYGTMNSVVRVE